MNTIQTDRPLTVQEAAQFTGFSIAYVYKLIHQKKIPCFKPEAGKVLFLLDDLKRFCYRNRQAADYEINEEAENILIGGRK